MTGTDNTAIRANSAARIATMVEQKRDPKIRLARELQAFCENLEWAANAQPGVPRDYRTIRQDMSLFLLKPLQLLLSNHPQVTTDWTPATSLHGSRFGQGRWDINFLGSTQSIGDILEPEELDKVGDLKGNLKALQTYLGKDNALLTSDPKDPNYHTQYHALTVLLERADATEGFWPWVKQRLTGVSSKKTADTALINQLKALIGEHMAALTPMFKTAYAEEARARYDANNAISEALIRFELYSSSPQANGPEAKQGLQTLLAWAKQNTLEDNSGFAARLETALNRANTTGLFERGVERTAAGQRR